MAAFNFPNSPSVNDTHTENSVTFKWNGTIWNRVGVAGAQGATGAAGAQGAQGAQGHQGVQGAANATTINSNTNNYLITGTGTANTIQGEANLTFDGDILRIKDASNDGALSQVIKLGNDSSGAGTGSQINLGVANGNESTSACINGFLDSAGGTSFALKTAGTYANQGTVAERLRIDSSGRLLVGTATAAGNGIHVLYSTVNSAVEFQNNTTGTGSGQGLYVGNSTSNIGYLWNYANDALVFATNNTERLRITADGPHLLLGGTSDVNEITESSGIAGMVIGGTGFGNAGLAIITSTTGAGRLYFGDNVGNDAGRNRGAIIYYHSSDHMHFQTAGSERLRITSDGKILAAGANSYHADADDLVLKERSGGNVGMTFQNTGTGYGVIYFADSGAQHSGRIQYDHSNDTLDLFAGGQERVTITSEQSLLLTGSSGIALATGEASNNFSGIYAGYHADNHGNQVIGLNLHLNYNSNSGTHQVAQTNAHGSIGSAGMFIGGNGSDNNSDICFFVNSQGSSAGATFGQDAWRLRIAPGETQSNYNINFKQRGYFRTETSYQTATNCPALAAANSYAYGYQEAWSTSGGQWLSPYPDLVFGYHTGMRFGGHPNYNGCRFYTDHPSSSSSIVLSIGNGGSGVHVVNTLSKGGGSFRIAHPHPTKKYTHDLQHSFIEGPQCDNIYRGKVDLVGGSASINIDTVSNMTDGTFVLLNRDIQCFTSNETGWDAVKGSVSGNVLTITSQNNTSTDTISWMVIGERQDDKIKSPDMDMTDSDGKLIVEPLTIEETHM